MFVGNISRKKSKHLESILSLPPFSLCISFKLLVLSFGVFFHSLVSVHDSVLSGSWIWHLLIDYGHSLLPTLSSNKHHCVFSSDVLHNFRRLLNAFFIFFCKNLPWYDIRKKKFQWLHCWAAETTVPVFQCLSCFHVPLFFLCTYYAVDLILGMHKGFGLWKSPEERTAPHLWMCICNALVFLYLTY